MSEEIIKYPISTEKAIRIMDSTNTLSFVVANGANKASIRKAVEDMFKVEVKKVQTTTQNGQRVQAVVPTHVVSEKKDDKTQEKEKEE